MVHGTTQGATQDPRVRRKRTKPTRGLVCYECTGNDVDVSSAARRLSRKRRGDTESRELLHASCRCRNRKCGNEWNSRHPLALAASREADARRVATVRVVNGQFKTRSADEAAMTDAHGPPLGDDTRGEAGYQDNGGRP